MDDLFSPPKKKGIKLKPSIHGYFYWGWCLFFAAWTVAQMLDAWNIPLHL